MGRLTVLMMARVRDYYLETLRDLLMVNCLDLVNTPLDQD